jgi:hypothetical protein
MLSTHIIGNYKFVLFVDDIGIERNSKKIMESILNELNLNFITSDLNHVEEITKSNQKTYVLLDNISRIELMHEESDIYMKIQSLKLNDNVIQIFGWISSKNIQSRYLIPFLEHMSEAIIHIKSSNQLSIFTKSKAKVVKLKNFSHELESGKLSLKELKVEKNLPEVAVEKSEDAETIGTFKIGQFTPEELEAKRNLKLPFELV